MRFATPAWQAAAKVKHRRRPIPPAISPKNPPAPLASRKTSPPQASDFFNKSVPRPITPPRPRRDSASGPARPASPPSTKKTALIKNSAPIPPKPAIKTRSKSRYKIAAAPPLPITVHWIRSFPVDFPSRLPPRGLRQSTSHLPLRAVRLSELEARAARLGFQKASATPPRHHL